MVEPVDGADSVTDDSLPADSFESFVSFATDGDAIAGVSDAAFSFRSDSADAAAAGVVAALDSPSVAFPLSGPVSSLPFRPRVSGRPRPGVGRAL